MLEQHQNQNFQDFEAIMVDDGSPDNSAQICQKFSAEDSRFKYVHQENQGVSVARNTGLKYAQGNTFTLWILMIRLALIFCKLCMMRQKKRSRYGGKSRGLYQFG